GGLGETLGRSTAGPAIGTAQYQHAASGATDAQPCRIGSSGLPPRAAIRAMVPAAFAAQPATGSSPARADGLPPRADVPLTLLTMDRPGEWHSARSGESS